VLGNEEGGQGSGGGFTTSSPVWWPHGEPLRRAAEGKGERPRHPFGGFWEEGREVCAEGVAGEALL
jgi:hypothetical protein